MGAKIPLLDSEISFKTSRSGGAGGQNVNKVSTKVLLEFDVANSSLLNEEQKKRVVEKLFEKLNKRGILQIVSQTERTQLGNKEIVKKKFYALLDKCIVKKKKRKPTKPSASAKEKRLKVKKRTAEIKRQRKNKE